MNSLKQPKIDSHLPFSERQAIIKLIAKKDEKKKKNCQKLETNSGT